jgi:predicted nucleic acid-binding protein
MAWCFRDEKNEYVDTVLDSLQEGEALVPSLWFLEVINALLTAERRKVLKEADSSRFLGLLASLPLLEEIGVSDRHQQSILHLGRMYSLSSYDASYMDLAMRRALPLATQDDALRRACKKSGVPLFGETSDRLCEPMQTSLSGRPLSEESTVCP